MTMEPDAGLTAVWAAIRPVGLHVQIQARKVLPQGGDPWQDTRHRLVSFGFMVRFVAYPDNRGRPAFLLRFLSRSLFGE